MMLTAAPNIYEITALWVLSMLQPCYATVPDDAYRSVMKFKDGPVDEDGDSEFGFCELVRVRLSDGTVWEANEINEHNDGRGFLHDADAPDQDSSWAVDGDICPLTMREQGQCCCLLTTRLLLYFNVPSGAIIDEAEAVFTQEGADSYPVWENPTVTVDGVVFNTMQSDRNTVVFIRNTAVQPLSPPTCSSSAVPWIIGIVVGLLSGILLGVLVTCCLRRRREIKNSEADD